MAILEVNAADIDGARRQLDQVVNVAAIQRKTGDLGGIDRARKLRVFCIDCGCFAGDLNHFTRLTEFHAKVDTLDSACIQR